MARSVGDNSVEPLEQAEPTEQATPARSNAIRNISPSWPGKATLLVCGSRGSGGTGVGMTAGFDVGMAVALPSPGRGSGGADIPVCPGTKETADAALADKNVCPPEMNVCPTGSDGQDAP